MSIPLSEVEFDIEGELVIPSQEAAILDALSSGAKHVAVLAHGWNNDMAEARALYADFLAALERVDPEGAATVIAIGVLWPSKRFAEKVLIPGGAASIRSCERRLFNFSTYYAMKERAGHIGRDAVNPLLFRIQRQTSPELHFHLVGHSFGGRLITAAVDGPCRLRVASLLLLQAAYSHNGLATNFDGQGKNGFFHRVLTECKVNGPIIVTHSKNDEAVGFAYPLASRLTGSDAARIGGARDWYGGMGANGAQHVDATCLKLGGTYDFRGACGRVFNLNGDAIIRNHNDVARPETAALLAAAIRQTTALSLPPG